MTITRVPGTTEDHLTTDPEKLTPDITEAEMVKTGRFDGHLHHDRWVVEGIEAKPQRGAPSIVTVWSPCCGRPRSRLSHGHAFSCPACGWWWRYYYVAATASTRAVSLGRNRPA
jgi:hypothetical protein